MLKGCNGVVLRRRRTGDHSFSFSYSLLPRVQNGQHKKKNIFIINTALGAVINKTFINKECTFPATSVSKNNQKKLCMAIVHS